VRKYLPHLFVLCALAAVALTGLPEALRIALLDWRFGLPSRHASGDVALVAIDSPSLDTVGVWPWPRTVHAQLIRNLESAGASDIALDIDFSAPSTAEADRAFVEALRAAGGSVILPSFEQRAHLQDHAIHVNYPLPQFVEHAWPAIVNVSADADGIVRRFPLGETLDGNFLPSMAALLSGKYERDKASFWIDFGIGLNTIPIVSYADVLRGEPAATARLAGKKVLVGGTALELGDRFNLPNGKIVSGAMLQVLAVESILQHRMLRFASNTVTWAGPCLVALLMLALWRRVSALARAALLSGAAIAGEAIAVTAQTKLPVIVDTSLLHLSIAAYLAAVALDELDLRNFVSRIAEKRFQRITMSLGDGVVCADQNGAITAWNPGATAIFGYEAAEMIGQPFARIVAAATGRAAFSLREIPPEKLRSAGGTAMELEGRRKNGEIFALEACFSSWGGSEGGHYGAILRDGSVRKQEAERMRYLAEHDTLTGLPNRNALHAHLCAKIAEAASTPLEIALLAISVDKFQLINDMHGPDFGEDLLRAVAERLSQLLSAPDLLARVAGDEFAVVVYGTAAIERATDLAFRMCSFGTDPIAVGMREQSIRLTVGVATYPKDCASADELFGNAHLALHRAKAVKRGGYLVFERGIRVELESRLILEAELARAIELDEFELFYQPQVTLQDSRLIGAEALIRWRHPKRGLLAPAEFMPIVNTSSISDRIAFWVMQTACKQARQWQRQGYDLPIAINLSPSQLRSDDIVGIVTALLAETCCPPHLLELEVTEDILVEDESAVEIFRRLRAIGVRILLDDFGTGYASLSYLKKFPLDGLKIDRSFVRELQADSDDAAIVGSIIGLGRQLGLTVLAEGIEDRATNDLLLRMGCNKGQGYYFGRPAPATEFEQKFLPERDGYRNMDASEPRPTAA